MCVVGSHRWQETVSAIAPQIRADGLHVRPFDPAFPVSVTYEVFGEGQLVRMNRLDYFKIVNVMSGEVTCQMQDRHFVAKSGELIVIGSSLYHRMSRHT